MAWPRQVIKHKPFGSPRLLVGNSINSFCLCCVEIDKILSELGSLAVSGGQLSSWRTPVGDVICTSHGEKGRGLHSVHSFLQVSILAAW